MLKNNLNVIEDIDSNNKYSYDIKINEITLPIKKGDMLGTILVKMNEKEVARGELISDKSVGRLSLFSLFKNNLFNIIFGNI